MVVHFTSWTASLCPPQVLMRSFGLDVSHAEVLDMIAEVDSDGSGRVEYSEFRKMLTAHDKSPQEVAREHTGNARTYMIHL